MLTADCVRGFDRLWDCKVVVELCFDSRLC